MKRSLVAFAFLIFVCTFAAPVPDKGGQVFNVKAYGAAGDGVTDDGAAINAAIAAASAAGGGIVYLPAGTYLLRTISTDPNSDHSYIVPKDGVSIVGAGMDVAVLKVASGQNALYPTTNAPNVITTKQSTPLSNCRFTDFTVDWNGANNLLTSDMARRQNASICSLHGGKNIVVERVHVKETPGDQCIYFPASSNAGQGHITVRDCIFENNGSGLAGNYNYDHSSVYCNGDYLLYENNYFSTTQTPRVFGACYEIHGSHSKAMHNTSNNYEMGCWIASNYEDITDIVVDGDSHTNCSKAFALAGHNYKMNQVTVANSTYVQATDLQNPTTTHVLPGSGQGYVPPYFVNGNTIAGCDSLKVTNCRFIGAGYHYPDNWANDPLLFCALMQVFNLYNVNFDNNYISGFGASGIRCNYPYNVDSLVIQNNVFKDVHKAILTNLVKQTFSSILIQNNSFDSTNADTDAVITIHLASSSGVVSGNYYGPNLPKHYEDASHGVVYKD
jgi:hypothetical protein